MRSMLLMTDVRKDPTNKDRAGWAQTALDAFVEEVGDAGDLGDNIGDLLCDIIHLCDAAKLDFDQLLDRARGHYAAEIGAPGVEPDWGTDPTGKATKIGSGT